jgi:hypothetical protein
VDRRVFYGQLYAALDAVSLVPLNEQEPPFPEDEAYDNGAERAETALHWFAEHQHTLQTANREVPLLLSRLLELMILDSKLLDASRHAAFAKRIAGSAAVAGDTGGSMGLLCVLQRMLRRQPKLRSMLENEAGGPSAYRTYRPELEVPFEIDPPISY